MLTSTPSLTSATTEDQLTTDVSVIELTEKRQKLSLSAHSVPTYHMPGNAEVLGPHTDAPTRTNRDVKIP